MSAEADRVQFWLNIWAHWMRSGQYRFLGYVVSGGPSGSLSFDDMLETDDRRTAKTVDALIRGLPEDPRDAVHHYHLGVIWRHTSISASMVYPEALFHVERGLNRWGIY